MKRQVLRELAAALAENRDVSLTFDMEGRCALQEQGRTICGDRGLPADGQGFFQRDGREFFTRRAARRRTLVLCGAGHVAYYAAQLARMLEYRTIVIDDREEFANSRRFPGAEVLLEPFDTGLEKAPYNKDTCFVIVTRGHQGDALCLEKILRQGVFGYLGMIGSRKKVGFVMEAMRQKGIPEELLQRVHSPIGLPIGAETPAEIAVSIFAEMIQEQGPEAGLGEDFLAHAEEAKAVAVILKQKGSAPRGPGAAMLVGRDGRAWGTIGGGQAEKLAIEEATGLEAPAAVRDYVMTGSEAGSTGMVCGGEIRVLITAVEE